MSTSRLEDSASRVFEWLESRCESIPVNQELNLVINYKSQVEQILDLEVRVTEQAKRISEMERSLRKLEKRTNVWSSVDRMESLEETFKKMKRVFSDQADTTMKGIFQVINYLKSNGYIISRRELNELCCEKFEEEEEECMLSDCERSLEEDGDVDQASIQVQVPTDLDEKLEEKEYV